jgi:hypothetical protein
MLISFGDLIIWFPCSPTVKALNFSYIDIKEDVYAMEVQESDGLISCNLIPATDIRGQPRQLVHVRDSV